MASKATSAITVDARFLGPVSPENEIRVGPGVDVALVRLDASLAALKADVVAVVDQVVERPLVARVVEPDPASEAIFGGDLLFVQTQRFEVEARDGETMTIVPLGDPALDERREVARLPRYPASGHSFTTTRSPA